MERSFNSDTRKHLLQHHPKTMKGGWHAARFIISVEFAQQFAFIGLSSNLITYLTNELQETLIEATKNINTWVFVSSVFPLLGAFIADSYIDRFKTVTISSFIYLLGMIFMTLSVSILKHDKLFFVALYVFSVGDGGIKSCVQPFAADQFDEEKEEQREAKSSFFNYWYLVVVLANSSAVFFIVYVQDNIGWTVGLGLPVGVWTVAIAVFLIGTKRYKRENPKGSPFTTIAQVLVAASLKWRLKHLPTHDTSLCYYGLDDDHHPLPTLEHTHHLKFLNKAMMIDENDASSKSRNPWRLCSVTQVEEVKLVLRLIPIWLCCVMFFVVQSQLVTFFPKQGSTMRRHIGSKFEIPPASLLGFVGIVMLCEIPVYDRVFVPVARKFTKHHSGITLLQKIGVGLFLSILNMIVSALVEAKRVGVAKQHNLIDDPNSILPISIWWLLPQYILSGTSDVFTIIGLQELFYDQMPEGLRSLGAAAFVTLYGVGSFFSNAIIVIMVAITSRIGEKWFGNNLNKAHLDYFYWLLAGLSVFNLCVYLWIAKGFVYKKVLNPNSVS
ncbi:protein NRT1/ PTR FAMILY 5.4-like [Arachis duranensis]|uniref:Protein NRT1/ PTR FAMILY 5.4-like n=1 Tax=Arachis duranensis TaxID=130453 RepID=A0A6P4BRE4_ARADU|nr:protein NRT1/ PTR FAMILY 5.4-like [Arachis duranensis]